MTYLYAPDRKADHTIRHLRGFVGTRQVNGYAGYNVVTERNAVSLAFCWSYVRREFYVPTQAGPAPIATEALARIAAHYQIEADIRGRPAEERRFTLQAREQSDRRGTEPWLKEKLGIVSQKSKLAEAIRYTLSRLRRLADRRVAGLDRRSRPAQRQAGLATFGLHQQSLDIGHMIKSKKIARVSLDFGGDRSVNELRQVKSSQRHRINVENVEDSEIAHTERN